MVGPPRLRRAQILLHLKVIILKNFFHKKILIKNFFYWQVISN